MKVRMGYKEVGKPLEAREIEDDYKVIQELCGGVFSGYSVSQFVDLPELRNVILYCNDTGKLDGLAPNCCIGKELLVGNIAFFAFDEHGEHIDMTAKQIEDLQAVLTEKMTVSFFGKEEFERIVAIEEERQKHETRRCGDCFWFCEDMLEPKEGICAFTCLDFPCTVNSIACENFEKEDGAK